MTSDTFRYWRLCAWGGPIFLTGFILFWGILGSNIPPVSPDLTAAELAHHYVTNAQSLRAAFVVSITAAVFYVMWSVAIYNIMHRMESGNHVLSQLQLFGGTLTFVPLAIACGVWLAAAYRPDRDPAIIQAFYDLGWMIMDCTFFITTLQMVAMAVGYMTDSREQPIVPKWWCWYTIWVAFIFFTELVMPYFKVGIFSFDGLVNYWVGFFAWFIWIIGQSRYTFVSISRLEQEEAAETGGARRIGRALPAA